MKHEEEPNINAQLIKKIKYLEYLNSSLTQTNKLLINKLASLTKKYNSLKDELYDTECHINFCKKNLLDLIAFKKEEDKEKKEKNFKIFKNKIKTLFEYGDEFMEINSEITIYNMIIDNIKNIKEENINLNRNLEELNKIIYQNNEYNEYNNFYPSSISVNNYNNCNNSQSSDDNLTNKKEYKTYDKNVYFSDTDEIGDDYLFYNSDEDYTSKLYKTYK